MIYKKLLYKKEKYNELLLTRTKHLLNLLSLSKNNLSEGEEINDIDNNFTKSEHLFNKIIETIDNEKLFLNPELDQKSLIRILGTNKKYLYEAIKLHGESNFRGIINRLRVNYAKKIIENTIIEKQTINFGELYSISGFNANSSFYRIFKSITGLSPSEYATEFKKEHIEKLKS
jgi:YesN/AraC family two-component response regulator